MAGADDQASVASGRSEKLKAIALIVLSGLAAATMALLLHTAGLVGDMDHAATDGLYALKQSVLPSQGAASPVVVVGIDEETLKEKAFAAPVPLWREPFESLLPALGEAGAAAIVLDVDLPGPDRFPGLAGALEKGAAVIVGLPSASAGLPADLPAPGQPGVSDVTMDRDGIVRRQRVVFSAQGKTPGRSVAFLAAKAFRKNTPQPGDSFLIDYSATAPGVAVVSFIDVHQAAVDGDAARLGKLFKGKIVFIGPTGPLAPARLATPLTRSGYGPPDGLARTMILAQAADTLIGGRIRTPLPATYTLLVFFVFGALAAAGRVLAGVRGAWIAGAVLCVLYPAAAFGLLTIQIVVPAGTGVLAVLLGLALASLFGRFLGAAAVPEKTAAPPAAEDETSRALRQGLKLQKQGFSDLAFEEFRKVPVDDRMKGVLYELGLDYERKRLFEKAREVYEYLRDADPGYKDVKKKIEDMSAVSETSIFGMAGGIIAEDGSIIFQEETRPSLGRYEIIETLGRGAMGTVYLGKDPKIGRLTAIKAVRFSDEYEEQEADRIRDQFFREAETAGRLSHPNIVTIYDAGEENELSYIAMELLEGHDLKAHTAKDNLLPLRKVLDIVAYVADALDYAHEQGVVHRDIKPANIMLLKNGTVKVADFGVARVMSSSKTKTGVIKGTPFYMSPEQIMGQKVDGRSDIFALGVVLYELLSGELPFQADELEALIFMVTRDDPEPVSSLNPKVPKVLDKIIAKALVKRREQRYQKASSLAEHLRTVGRKFDEVAAKQKKAVKKKK